MADRDGCGETAAKRHHIVPQTYLKNFGLSKGDRPSKHVSYDKKQEEYLRNQSSVNIAVIKDFNKSVTHPGAPSEFESWLCGQEGLLSSRFRAHPATLHRDWLCRAAALQHIRSQQARDGINQAFETTLEEWSIPGVVSIQRRADKVAMHYYAVRLGLTKYAGLLAQRRIYSVENPYHNLITSDSPVAQVGPGGGLIGATRVVFPWNRTTAIVFGPPCKHLADLFRETRIFSCPCSEATYIRHGGRDERFTVDTALMADINRLTYSNAQRFVYGHPSDESLIQQSSPSVLGPIPPFGRRQPESPILSGVRVFDSSVAFSDESNVEQAVARAKEEAQRATPPWRRLTELELVRFSAHRP